MKRFLTRTILIKTTLLITAGLFISNAAYAGEIMVISCDRCDYRSDPLYEGEGFAGVPHTIIYCPACKKFLTILTETLKEAHSKINEKIYKDAKVSPSAGEENFLGEKCRVFTCPACQKKAFEYNGKKCPLCLKGRISGERVGLWD